MAKLTAAQVAAVIARGPNPPGNTKPEEWVALAMRESSGLTDVYSPSRRHRGLWQIGLFHNAAVRPDLSQAQFAQWLTVADNNWQAAVNVYNRQGWGAWEASHAPTAESRAAVRSPDKAGAESATGIEEGLSLPNPIGAALDVGSAIANGFGAVIEFVNRLGGWVSDPHNWVRVGYVAGGALLVVMAGAAIASDTKAGQAVIGTTPVGKAARVIK